MKWLRLYTDVRSDPKLSLLSFDDQRHYIWLLTLKCDGSLDQFDGEMLDRLVCKQLGLDPSACCEVKRRLQEVRLIDANWQPLSWERRQYKHDDSKERVKRYRERKALETKECNACNGDVTVTVTGTETETETDKSSYEDSSPQAATCPQQQILDLYHETLPELRRMRVWNDARAKDLRARWRQSKDHQDLDWWRRFFLYVRECPFLMGQRKDWSADLAWLVRADNFSKVINGNYQEAA